MFDFSVIFIFGELVPFVYILVFAPIIYFCEKKDKQVKTKKKQKFFKQFKINTLKYLIDSIQKKVWKKFSENELYFQRFSLHSTRWLCIFAIVRKFRKEIYIYFF